jgi:CheY-like chemotaxis protein
VWIDADPTRIAQVLGNLLQNAVKFTQRERSVAVSVGVKGDRAELCVRDEGAGMDPATVEHMFEPFAQADQSLARTSGGLGLGLALVKGIVELHGGAAEAYSEGLGHGAEFRVRLPLAEAGAGIEPEGGPRAEGDRKRVLVIEDNVDSAQSLADILELAGHDVRIAHDGRSGLTIAREYRPDVILCDIGLPGLDGYEVAEAVRRDDSLRSVRLVALSGYAQPEDRQRTSDAGFELHIAKPPDLDALVAAVAKS